MLITGSARTFCLAAIAKVDAGLDSISCNDLQSADLSGSGRLVVAQVSMPMTPSRRAMISTQRLAS